jgi:L-histidine N-alpha-methyltransferase
VGGRIEMHLVADGDQVVTVSGLDDLVLDLRDGEHLRTEISTKFTPDRVAAELDAAGLEVVDRWFDDDGDFLLTLARPSGRA